MDDDRQRKALIEGFVNMADVDNFDNNGDDSSMLRKPGSHSAMAGKEYVDMDDMEDTAGQRAHAELKENTNIFKSAFHVFKANVGTAVFMLPTFYPDAGYIVSVILALFIGAVVVDCTHLLINAKTAVNRRDVTTYSQLCRYVLGTGLGWFLFGAMVTTQFGFCLMYSQLFSATMDELVSFSGSHYLWVSLILIVGFAMTCFSDNLSLLSIASIIATISVFYSLVCCFVETCRKLGSTGVDPSCDVAGYRIPIGWFNNLANNMMSLEGIAIILPMHAACTQKRLVPRMVTIVLICVICLYLVFGLLGYLAYGNTLTTSLVASVEYTPWGTSIRVFFLVNIVFSYPLQFMSAMQLIDQVARCKPRSWVGLGLRFLINLIIWALAMGLPADAVNTVVAFIGALPSCCMVMVIPSLLSLHTDYAVSHPDENRNTKAYWKKVFVVDKCFTFARIRAFAYLVIAALIMVIGTYSIIAGLIGGDKKSH